MNEKFGNAALDFSLELLRKLAAEKDGENIICSPASITMALGMVYNGAAGDTEKQMGKVIFNGLPKSEVLEQFPSLITSLNPKSDSYSLHTANRLYAQESHAFLQEYLDSCVKQFQSELKPVNFGENGNKIVDEVNKWVQDKTANKIEKLLESGSLTSDVKLLIVNAIYFKALWKKEFNVSENIENTFMGGLEGNQEINVEFMREEAMGIEHYYEDESVQAINLPYRDCPLVMSIYLPKAVNGLSAFLGTFTADQMIKIQKAASSNLVTVWIPKFEIETSASLTDTLASMGMPDAFTASKADFSKMNGQKDLYASKVVHKAFIEVNEKGTEAAAATGICMHFCSSTTYSEPPKLFRADHPFLYTITDTTNHAVLFAGVLSKPDPVPQQSLEQHILRSIQEQKRLDENKNKKCTIS